MQELYDSMDWPDWQQNYDTIHLLINHRSYLDPHFKEYICYINVENSVIPGIVFHSIRYSDFNERNIQHYPYMFGQLALLVMPGRSAASTTTQFTHHHSLFDSETNLIVDDSEQERPPDPTED